MAPATTSMREFGIDFAISSSCCSGGRSVCKRSTACLSEVSYRANGECQAGTVVGPPRREGALTGSHVIAVPRSSVAATVGIIAMGASADGAVWIRTCVSKRLPAIIKQHRSQVAIIS